MIIAIIILSAFSVAGIVNSVLLHIITNKYKEKQKDFDKLLERHDKFADQYGLLVDEIEQLEKKYTELQKFFGRVKQ